MEWTAASILPYSMFFLTSLFSESCLNSDETS
uniref:Uncharacterized protein n=1 Tax=Arundo donax TaxID=35708 RepID=A0A0A9FP57_ARUDO